MNKPVEELRREDVGNALVSKGYAEAYISELFDALEDMGLVLMPKEATEEMLLGMMVMSDTPNSYRRSVEAFQAQLEGKSDE